MIQSPPKISIVTPSFNQAQFIEFTIRSVLNQNYPNLEFIIVDGQSTDNSLEIISKYAQQLHFWCSEPDGGQYDAINKGFAQASGDILCWLNSDDMYFPWTLKTVASIMTQFPQVEWLTTSQLGLWDAQGFCVDFFPALGYSKEAFLDGGYSPWGKAKYGFSCGWIQQESTFWRRSLWEKVGGYLNTDFKLAADFDLWSRFYCHADLYATASPLGGFRRHPDQKTSLSAESRLRQYISEAEQSLDKMRECCNWQPHRFRQISNKLGLQKVPKLKKLLTSKQGYLSKKIVRKNIDQPDPRWEITESKFLP